MDAPSEAAPRPDALTATPAPALSASSWRAASGTAPRAPPPTRITGRSAARNADRSSGSSILVLGRRTSPSTVRPSGISSSTGPPGTAPARASASAIAPGSAAPVSTRSAQTVTGAASASVGASWNARSRSLADAVPDARTSTGACAASASRRDGTVAATPGPRPTTTTAGRRDAIACPAAADTAVRWLLIQTKSMPAARNAASEAMSSSGRPRT